MNVQMAVMKIFQGLNKDEVLFIKNCKETNLNSINYVLGHVIRMNLGIYEYSCPLYEETGKFTPEDVSLYIIHELWNYLQGK